MKLDIASVRVAMLFCGSVDVAKLEEADGIGDCGWGGVCWCSESSREGGEEYSDKGCASREEGLHDCGFSAEWLIDRNVKNDGEDEATR